MSIPYPGKVLFLPAVIGMFVLTPLYVTESMSAFGIYVDGGLAATFCYAMALALIVLWMVRTVLGQSSEIWAMSIIPMWPLATIHLFLLGDRFGTFLLWDILVAILSLGTLALLLTGICSMVRNKTNSTHTANAPGCLTHNRNETVVRE